MKFTDVIDNILAEEHSRLNKHHVKDALEIATQLANRGYYPEEAVEFAVDSIRVTSGYELTPEEKAAVLQFTPVHRNFSENINEQPVEKLKSAFNNIFKKPQQQAAPAAQQQAPAEQPSKHYNELVQMSKDPKNSNLGFGFAQSRDASIAQTMAHTNAMRDLARKLGKTEMSGGFPITDYASYGLQENGGITYYNACVVSTQ